MPIVASRNPLLDHHLREFMDTFPGWCRLNYRSLSIVGMDYSGNRDESWDCLYFTKVRRKAPDVNHGDIRRDGQGAHCPEGREDRFRVIETCGIL